MLLLYLLQIGKLRYRAVMIILRPHRGLKLPAAMDLCPSISVHRNYQTNSYTPPHVPGDKFDQLKNTDLDRISSPPGKVST